MAFGWPSRYWQLDLRKVEGGPNGWDKGVAEASSAYGRHTHNLCCDNCHSHVAMALNEMHYDSSTSWNMFKLAAGVQFKGRSVSLAATLKQWIPFLIMLTIILIVIFVPPALA